MTHPIIASTGLEAIISAFTAALMAQLLKLFFEYRKKKKANFRILVGTGGMPSSHSAFVMALATSIGSINGFRSIEFALALGFAFIVMYDAAGLRRSAGKMAHVLNNIIDDVYPKDSQLGQNKLMELLGHTPMQVLMGALLGVVMALAIHNVIL
ncbi:MAG: divergent PAP2 family protein [Vampirovibrionia bacterium]